jgi:hypothetical protein
MKKYIVPVIYTTTGYIEIDSENPEKAREEAKRLNKEGIEYLQIRDANCESELILDEIEEV